MILSELQNALAGMKSRKAELVQLIAAFTAIQQDVDQISKNAFDTQCGASLETPRPY